ncbi:tandem-95 repeat protein [Nocardioides humilatus]|uniref:Tandem-95 repeat protein n=1 Tax=Nocardioides humilatus TaxID=2607660 RepID=A0A5B1LAK4_9ACTN|nr:Ig-like domain-containing protein [Nocardioides humilatus]KAA1417771.1 tandem-95 repeat protein [Nocardioides humilatus]
MAAFFVPAAPWQAAATPPPLGSTCTIEGTTGPDTLDGTAAADVICGYGGDDTIDGLGGDDLIIGGAGDDNLLGGDGIDDIRGNGGTDTLTGNAGNDLLYGDGGNDSVDGSEDDDTVTGGPGDDTLTGGLGADTLWGQAGIDTGNGGDGADKIDGGGDADVLHGNVGADQVTGGTGDDDLYGDEDDDVLRGGTGNDDHFGGVGNDTVYDQDGVGFVDTVSCGDSASDIAYVDTFDSVNVDCETKKAIDRDDPVAVNDTKTVIEDAGPRIIEVLANDTDTDGGAIRITAVSNATHGTVSLPASKKRVTYEPDPDYCNTPPGTAPDTFTYTLSPGGSIGTVSVKVACRADNPTASDDTDTVLEDDPATTIDVLANDSDPDGVGLVIDTVTQPTNGTVVKTNGGADLTYEPNADYCNDGLTTDDFDYTLTNGGDTGTVQVTVTCVQDDPVASNDTKTVLEDASATTIDVLANDSDADGDAFSITSTTDPANGTVAVTNAGADLTYTPDADYCNDPPGNTPDTFDYTLTPGGATGTVEVTVTCVNDDPVADDESFATAIGNTVFVVDDPTDAAPSESGPHKTITGDILDGDTDIDSAGPLTITAETVASADGGSAVIEADGDFVFTPKAGTSCTDHTDSFDYEVNDGDGGTGAGTVTITIANCVWYVKNNAAAGGTGVSSGPFDTITEAETASLAGETIFVYNGDSTSNGYGGDGLVLKNNQQLIGEYVGLTVGGDTLVAPSAFFPPILTATNADVITLASGNTLAGLLLDPNGTGGGIAGGVGDNGGTVTKVKVSDEGTAGTQPMVELDGVSGTWNLSGISGDNHFATGLTSGSVGLRLNNTTGSISIIDVDLTPDPFENNSFITGGAKVVDATNAQAVSGKMFARAESSTTGGVTWSNVSANAGTGMNFTGVQVTTAGGTGFSATSSGPITIGSNSSIVNTNGRALVVQNTTIAAGNIAFQKVSSTGGDVGILLDNTGNLGRLTVAGTGGTCTNADTSGCSGGTITGQTGADSSSATPGGTGIVLNNTLNPSFVRMWIHGVSNYGIRGTNVAGFTLNNSVINGLNGDSLVNDDASARFTNLTGTVNVLSSFFSGGYTDNLAIETTSGSATVTMSVVTFGTSAADTSAPRNDALRVETTPAASALSLAVTNSAFQNAAGDLLSFDHNGTGTGSVTLGGNTFSDSNPAISTGGGGVSLFQGGGTGATTMTINNNTFRDAVGYGVLISKSTPGASTMSGTFQNNTIGVSGTANSGSREGSALKIQNIGGGSVSWTINSSNQIYGYNNYGIEVQAGGGASAQSGQINATISGNTIAEAGNTAGTIGIPKNGVHANIGTVSGDTFQACLDVKTNTLDQSGADAVPPTIGSKDVRYRQRQSTTILVPGYAGAPNDNIALQTYVDSLNSGTVDVLASNTHPTGGGFQTAAACPT